MVSDSFFRLTWEQPLPMNAIVFNSEREGKENRVFFYFPRRKNKKINGKIVLEK